MKNLIHHSITPVEDPHIILVDLPIRFEGEKHRESVLVGAKAVKKLVEVQEEARTDALTGLTNRKGFDEGLDILIESANKETEPHLAYLFIDLDNFKQVNDEHPEKHAAGDKVLITVGEILTNTLKLRDDEVAGRVGGDEFAIAIRTINRQNGERNLKMSDQEVIEGFKQRLQDEVKRLSEEIGMPTLGVSVGVVMYKKGETAEEFRARADAAMYEMKQTKDSR